MNANPQISVTTEYRIYSNRGTRYQDQILPLFKKTKQQYINGAGLEEGVDYEPMSPGH